MLAQSRSTGFTAGTHRHSGACWNNNEIAAFFFKGVRSVEIRVGMTFSQITLTNAHSGDGLASKFCCSSRSL